MEAPRESSTAAKYSRGGVTLYWGDTLHVSKRWPTPVVIIVDGPYGLGSFPGDPSTPDGLAEWYRPYVQWWAERSTPETTLWLWNSEIGWAKIHPVFEQAGWRYRSCHIWDKGVGHIAGNSNGKTLRKFPVVTEVCVQYVREAEFRTVEKSLSMQEWLRHEWARTRLPFSKANEACGVANAATRKYLTTCHLWYYPPVEAFTRLADYANKHGDPRGRPYFSVDGRRPIPPEQWERMRSKFYCEHGVTNVWREPQVRNGERVRVGTKCAHMNQKPLRLMELIMKASSDPGDVIWEPFGGLCTAAVASYRLRRRCFSSELLEQYYAAATKRLARAERLQRPDAARPRQKGQEWPARQGEFRNATLF
jgi:hypothetical protein